MRRSLAIAQLHTQCWRPEHGVSRHLHIMGVGLCYGKLGTSGGLPSCSPMHSSSQSSELQHKVQDDPPLMPEELCEHHC